jgi:hypothetical protein
VVTTRDTAQELARLLLSSGEAPIDDGGATAIFEAITGGPLTADISVRPACDLSDEEQALLGTLLPADAHRRDGLLRCATGIPVARVTALVITSRVPEPARNALGIAPCGHLLNPQQEGTSHTPLGHALRGLGISREQLGAAVTPGHAGDGDSEIAVLSSARLWRPSGWPLALVTEQIYTQFLDAYPPPWPLADAKWPRISAQP